MAVFPCDVHGARYTGPQQTIYPAILGPMSSDRVKRRLCSNCFDHAIKFAEQRFEEVGVNEEPATDECSFCDQPYTDWRFFLTVYEKGQERRDFYGRLCDGCVQQARDIFLGSPAPLLVP